MRQTLNDLGNTSPRMVRTHSVSANQNQLFIYKMMVSEGVNKRGLDPWNPTQIGAVIR